MLHRIDPFCQAAIEIPGRRQLCQAARTTINDRWGLRSTTIANLHQSRLQFRAQPKKTRDTS